MIPAIIVLCRLAWHIDGHNIFGQENIKGIRGFLKICRHRHYLEKCGIDDNGLSYEDCLILLLELADDRAFVERIATDEDFMKFLIAKSWRVKIISLETFICCLLWLHIRV
jgi:hypothetical protein